MLSGQGGPARVGTRVHFVNSVGHEMVSLVPARCMTASCGVEDIIPETRSVSFLIVRTHYRGSGFPARGSFALHFQDGIGELLQLLADDFLDFGAEGGGIVGFRGEDIGGELVLRIA